MTLLVVFLVLVNVTGRGSLSLEEGTSTGTARNARGQVQSGLGNVAAVALLDAVGQAGGAVGNVVAARVVLSGSACCKFDD